MAKGIVDNDKLWRQLEKNLKNLSGQEVNVGIQAGEKAEDGKADMAMIAAVHEFGMTINIPAGTVNQYRQVNKKGDAFAKGGRLVSKSKSNFVSEHGRKAYSIQIPRRSFLRSTADEKEKEIMQFSKIALLQDAIPGNTHGIALHKIGIYVTGLVQRKIVKGPFVPNAPSTVRKKRSTRPLIDKGHMRQSVRHVVKKGK